MTEEETFAAEPKEKRELELAALKKPSYIAALFLIIFAATALAYGLANGYVQVSAKPENRAEKLQSEIAELSKQKEMLEQKRAKIAEQLQKTKLLVEKSKDSSPEVDAHIQVLSSSCLSCPPPAWVESYRTAFSSLEEIEKIINEDISDVPSK